LGKLCKKKNNYSSQQNDSKSTSENSKAIENANNKENNSEEGAQSGFKSFNIVLFFEKNLLYSAERF
jgi:hypothetical protein